MERLTELPEDLPVPVDDGACHHLRGQSLPSLFLSSTQGRRVDLSAIPGYVVIYCYPMTGKPGNLTINARESIEVTGRSENFPSGIFTSAIEGSGDGGNVNIVTDKLVIKDEALISVGNLLSQNLRPPGTGAAGNLEINARSVEVNKGMITADNTNGIGGALLLNADSLTLENEASISAETTANTGTGGNINLNVDGTLQMRDNSLISGQAIEGATGGNIDIDTEFIVAFPNQNNDIIASAERGQGGNIDITAEALFGIEEREATPGNETNDIDASSEFGLSGTVNITQPDVNPASGLVDLTQEVVNASDLIAQNVCTQTANSEFVDIGKGGLPQNPEYVLAEDTIEVGLVAPIITSSEATEPVKERIEVKPKITRKPPAQGWIFHENGIVELVAYNPHQVGEQRTWDNHRGCQ